MTKKTAITLLTIISATSIGVATGFSQNSQSLLSSKADDSVSWYHYKGTPATFSSSGVKDYWTDCKGTTITSHPGKNAVIAEHRNIPETTVIDETDARYLSAVRRSYNFEDGILPDLFSPDGKTRLEVCSEAAFMSNYGLKLSFTATGDYMVRVDKSFYDAVFADPSVVSIDFDAKSNYYTNNFRYTQLGTNTTYEVNDTSYGHGIGTTWKTYHYTRDAYNALCADTSANKDQYTLFTGAIVNKDDHVIYVDNIRYSRVGGDYSKKITFNDGAIRVIGNDRFVLSSNSGSTNDMLLKINSENISSIELVDSVHLEGTRALKIHKDKGGYACLVLNSRFMNAVPTDGAFLFDMYIENIEGSDPFYSSGTYGGIRYGDNKTYLPMDLNGGKFYTIRIPKSLCSADNRFLYFNGSATIGDVYLDNFRIEEKRGDFDYDFESGYSEQTSATTYTYRAKNNTNSTGYNARLQVLSSSAEKLNVTYGGLSTEFVSQGDYSFKFTKENGYCSVYLNNFVSQLKSDSSRVTFDLYSTIAANGTVGNFQYGNGTNYPSAHPANKWTRYTFTKSQLSGDGRLFILNGSTAGDWYIDNIVVTNEVEPITYNFESGVTEHSDITYSYRLATGTAAKMQIIDTSNIVSAFELSEEQVNEGSKAIKFTKSANGYISLHLNGIYGEMSDSSTVSFDLFATVGLNSNSTFGAVTNGVNGYLGEDGYQHPANTWVRYTFSKSQITSDGRFLIFQGSPTFDAYIDNVVITR